MGGLAPDHAAEVTIEKAHKPHLRLGGGIEYDIVSSKSPLVGHPYGSSPPSRGIVQPPLRGVDDVPDSLAIACVACRIRATLAP